MSNNQYDTSALRLRACATAPYLATAFYNMILRVVDREDKDMMKAVPTMGVDKYWRCYINPNYAEEIGIELAAHVLIHEVYHLISNHAERAENKGITEEGRDKGTHLIWNIAADCAINQDLKKCGWHLPDGCQYPEMYKDKGVKSNMLAEEIYDKLMEHIEIIKITMPAEGSGVTGIPEDWEEGSGRTKEDDSEPVENQKGQIIRRQIAKDIQKSQGNVPAGLKRWADEHLNPKIDWRTKLQSAIRGQIARAAGMVDFSYSRPSRRASCYGNIILPRMVKPIPDVSLLIDTSGSMDQSDITVGAAEAKGILDTLGTPIKVFTADTEVHTQQNIMDVTQIEFKGGGGTDMDYAMQEVAEKAPAALLVVVTDGWTGWPKKKINKFDHVIAVITRSGKYQKVPKWIEVIQIKND